MKKKILTVALAAGLSFGAFASNVGPGLGGMLLGNSNSLLGQTVAIWLNGIFCNQTFAVTFGTSGASGWKSVVMAPTEQFINENMDFVAADIAVGEGEYLDTVAALLEVEDVDTFKANAQANFNEIFSSADVSAAEVTEKLAALI